MPSARKVCLGGHAVCRGAVAISCARGFRLGGLRTCRDIRDPALRPCLALCCWSWALCAGEAEPTAQTGAEVAPRGPFGMVARLLCARRKWARRGRVAAAPGAGRTRGSALVRLERVRRCSRDVCSYRSVRSGPGAILLTT